MTEVTIGSLWRHKASGRFYQVYDLTNEASDRVDYPRMVSYRRLIDGTKWSRLVSEWHRSYEPISIGDLQLLYNLQENK